MLFTPWHSLIFLSMALFTAAAISDYLDGYIANKCPAQRSVFGTFFDPLVDKMMILSLYIIFGALRIIPLWLVLLLLFRELMVTGIRQVCSTQGKTVGANWMGKAKFVLQTLNILYLQAALYCNVRGINSVFFYSKTVLIVTMAVVLFSVGLAFNFMFWYRKTLFKDL